MRKLYHSAIFYPEERDAINAMTSAIERNGRKAKALILPHGDLRKLFPLYREAFSNISNGISRVIIITPIHAERLEKDEGSIVFEGESGILETPYGSISLDSLGLSTEESYAEEESAPEIILPFIKACIPDASVFIVYAKIEKAEDSKKLASMIAKWQSDDTLFIISSNLTGRIKEADLGKSREDAVNAIIDGMHLLDARNRHIADICGAGIIDSYNRISKSSWNLIALSDNDTITGHGAFYKE